MGKDNKKDTPTTINTDFISEIKERDKHIPDVNVNDDIVIYGDDSKDYMQYSWKLFGNRPSKISIYSELESELLWNIITDLFEVKECNINQMSEIFFESIGTVHENTFYIQLTKFISIYFVENQVMALNENTGIEEKMESYCFNLNIYFNKKHISSEEMNSILSIFSQTIDTKDISEIKDTSDNNNSIFTLNIEDGNFSLDTLSLNDMDTNELKYSFNADVLKDTKKLITSINSNDKSIDIICGERGVGKTELVVHVCKQVSKKVIIVPLGLIDTTFNNIMFLDFLKAHPNSVVLIEDCENFFDKKNQNNNMFSLNLLQIMEGIYSSTININFLLTMNNKHQSIDYNLANSMHIKNIIEVSKLTKNKAIKLAEVLNIKDFDKYMKEMDMDSIKLNDIHKGVAKRINKGDKYF